MKERVPRKWLALCATAAILVIVIGAWWASHPRMAEPRASLATPELVATNPAKPVAEERSQESEVRSQGVAQETQPADEFRNWVARFQQETDAAVKARLESEGEALALERRERMARLIEEDPQRALQEAIPFAQRQQLPPSIAQHVEQVVSGRGTLGVLGVLPEEDAHQAPGIVRTAQFADRTYRAFVYGRRLSQMTTENIPLHGIAIGDALALAESPVRVLDAAEAVARAGEVAPENAKCPVSGTALTVEDAAAVVDVGGQIRILCNGGHIEVLEGQLLAAEGTSGGAAAPAAALDSWSQGPKTLLYIRVRFSDQTNDPQSLIDAQTMVSSVDSFFRECSYETTTIAGTFTPVYTLSNNTAYYVSNDIYAVRNDALAIAKANGYDSVNYNLDAVRYNGGPGSFSGAAYVHARGCWLKSSSAGVAAHEFGHNYGLYHANSLNPTDDSPIGPGTWQEYGDAFDTMGSANAGAYHYNVRYKSILNWIPPDGYLTASNNGTYRVYAHDIITSSNLIRGLRVPRDSIKNYWVDFRQKFTGNVWLMNGAGLRRADNNNNNMPGSELLDTTPQSPDGKTDAGLLIGRTFSDASSGVHITPIGKGGTSPESLDVVVNFGTFPGNAAPSLAIGASATAVPVGTAVIFTGTASDVNGDPLAYYWDFDDKTYGLNGASVSKSWSTVGEYIVRCVVSDMKGGTASRWMVITVGSPTTFRVSGRVTDGNGVPMEGVRVHNGLTGSAYRGCFTDVDGYYTVARLASGSYTMGAAYYGFTMAPAFANPVTVGPSKTDVNFVGSIKTYSISGRVTDGGVGLADVQVSDGVRSASSNTNGDYTISSVPNGSYTLTATKSGYTISPSGWANPVVVADASTTNRHFTTATYTISGEITGVPLTNAVTVTDGYRTTVSSKQGSGSNQKNLYTLSGVPSGTWNIRAQFPGSSFTPSTFSNPLTITGNASTKNFALDAVTTYSISGTISYNGVGLAGATVTAGSRSSVTDARGGYYISGLGNGTYTVVPTLSGYGFTPASTDVTVSSAHVTGQNFGASQVIIPTVTLTATDAAASETGSNTGLFTVARNGSTLSSLTVFYSVSGTATAGADYATLSGSVTIPSGSTSATITITPVDDTEPECSETVVVTLTANGSYIVGSPAATVAITDNDLPTVSIIATDASASEVGVDTGTLLVTRNGCLSSPLTVSYTLGGSATSGSDYQALSGSVAIPAGAASVTITITPIDDSFAEGDETAVVALAANASYVVGSPSSASVTIADDEANHAPTANAGPDQSISVLGLAILNGSATDDGLPGSGLTYSWSKVSGPGTAVAANPTAQNTSAFFSMAGTYVLRLSVSDGQLSGTDDVTITVTGADPAKVVNAINAGGPQFVSDVVYRGDGWFTGGSANTNTAAIAGTTDTALYQTARTGDFSYDIPTSGGTQDYLLVLKFAETSATAAGQRVFDVLVNGTLIGDNLDIFAQAGANTAFDLVLPITASGDVLSIQFQTEAGSALPAMVNAIVVGAAQVPSPAAPSSLNATAVSGSQINLSWTDNAANEAGFQIEASLDGSNYSPIATVGANVTSYSHTGMNPNTTCYYRVRACNSAGCSSDASAAATTLSSPPAAPTNLSGSAQTGGRINLSWTQNSSNEDGFIVERSSNGTSFTVIATTGPNATAYSVTGLASNTRYYFRVRAFNSLGSSAYSNTLNIRSKK